MADKTLVGWCDSACNPAMGCDRCPPYPPVTGLRLAVGAALVEMGVSAEAAMRPVEGHVDPLDHVSRGGGRSRRRSAMGPA